MNTQFSDKTAASDASFARVSRTVLVVCSLLGSAAQPTNAGVVPGNADFRAPVSGTTAGQSRGEVARRKSGINELRRLTGLTWDQVAQLFGVSRRSVHHWAGGKDMSAENERHLESVLSWLHGINRGTALLNRRALFAVDTSGVSAFDLLVLRDYPSALNMLGIAADAPRQAARPSRVPSNRVLPVEVLADAEHDIAPLGFDARRPARVSKRRA